MKQFSQITDDKLSELLPNKEDVFVTKIETHNEICVTCYCLNKNPLFFEMDKEKILYPTGKLLEKVSIKTILQICYVERFHNHLRGGCRKQLSLPISSHRIVSKVVLFIVFICTVSFLKVLSGLIKNR